MMESALTSSCDYCATKTDELFPLPLVLRLGDRMLAVVCRLCYTRLSGAEPSPRLKSIAGSARA